MDPVKAIAAALPQDRVTWANQQEQRHQRLAESESMGISQYTLVLGDAFISPMNFSGSTTGAAVKTLSDWLDKKRRRLGIDPRLLIQAHVHNCCLLHVDGGNRTWVEPGLAARPSIESDKYPYPPKWRPGVLGFVVFEQRYKK